MRFSRSKQRENWDPNDYFDILREIMKYLKVEKLCLSLKENILILMKNKVTIWWFLEEEVHTYSMYLVNDMTHEVWRVGRWKSFFFLFLLPIYFSLMNNLATLLAHSYFPFYGNLIKFGHDLTKLGLFIQNWT